ncbi:hypothetical protein KIN20_018600 [Parelaphostrongylus tenuis]|uniref:MYND-type domain-containing protein n=1 Tax=Parelaphostrongylus tenuis TaxID=148309 RepID=A0AAD5QSA6_PARTN|nr:hypothetical protein KIN20_018600 [Parelaphostrongylus tenuis]
MTSKSKRLRFYPFAYALFNEELSNYCWYCLNQVEIKRRCLGCQFALFCGKTCQNLGWKDHKAECKGLQKSISVPDIETRMLGRIVLRYKEICSGKDKNTQDFYKDRTSRRNILEVWSHTDKILTDTYAMNKFEGIYKSLVQFYERKFLLPKEVVFELHCRNYINRHAISDKSYMKEIGKGLYLDLCAYDHSCRPNSFYTCEGFVATLRGLDSNVDIEDRTTTFYTYIALMNSLQQRKKQLRDTWYFDCLCERCTDPADNLLTSVLCPNCPPNCQQSVNIFEERSSKISKSKSFTCSRCRLDLSEKYIMEAMNAMRFINKIIEDKELEQMPKRTRVEFLEDLLERFSKILSDTNIYLCEVIQNLILFVPSDNNEEMLRLHLKAESCVRLCFPQNHPALALHLRNIGIFLNNLGRHQESVKYLREAYEMMEFSLDSDHMMTMECWSVLKQALDNIDQPSEDAVQVSVPSTDTLELTDGSAEARAVIDSESTMGIPKEDENVIVMEPPVEVKPSKEYSSIKKLSNKFTDLFLDDISDLPELNF